MLMAGEVELPRHLFIHGFLLMQGEKMSKTLGNVLDPFQVIDLFGVDALRYYCFREVSFGQDGSISTEGFEARYNTELANDYGNLASRTLAMIDRYRDGVVPDADAARRAGGGLRRPRATTVAAHLDHAELTLALEEIWKRGVRRLNQFVEEQAPWNLAKDDGTAAALDETLYGLAEGLRVVSVLLHPYMPDCGHAAAGGAGRRARTTLPRSSDAEFGARPGRRDGRADPAALPEGRGVEHRRRAALTPRQLAMLGAVSAIWGASYLLIKIALDGFEPAMIVFPRVLLAALLLYVVILARGGADRAALGYLRRRPRGTLVQGALAVAMPVLADQLRRDADLLGADRRADLAGPAVHRAARAADRPDREGRPPRGVRRS